MVITLINYIILIVIGLYVVHGVYKGFAVTLFGLCNQVFSWFTAFTLVPFVTKIMSKGNTFEFMMYMMEDPSRIETTELARTSVSSLSRMQIENKIGRAHV